MAPIRFFGAGFAFPTVGSFQSCGCHLLLRIRWWLCSPDADRNGGSTALLCPGDSLHDRSSSTPWSARGCHTGWSLRLESSVGARDSGVKARSGSRGSRQRLRLWAYLSPLRALSIPETRWYCRVKTQSVRTDIGGILYVVTFLEASSGFARRFFFSWLLL
jgi:hypothetical protein